MANPLMSKVCHRAGWVRYILSRTPPYIKRTFPAVSPVGETSWRWSHFASSSVSAATALGCDHCALNLRSVNQKIHLSLSRDSRPSHRRNFSREIRKESSDQVSDKMTGGSASPKSFLTSYKAPDWASHLKAVPSQKVQLGNFPTPIHRWYLPGLPEGVEVYIKRDDMTGSTLSGNKVRKLEFLLADCIEKGCSHVVTCGGIQSNHCRSTAVAAAQLGLTPHLVLRTPIQEPDDLRGVGNVLLDQLSGAKLYLVPHVSPHATHLIPRMTALANTIRKQSGEECYVIPVGGTNEVGVWGYLEGFSELLQQGVAERFDDIAFACGSGGTAEGLALGNYLSQSKLKIHGLAVSDDRKSFNQHLNEILTYFDMDNEIEAADILDVIEGPKGRGYGISTEEELDFALEVSRKTGIMLDPVYTGKAVRGLVKELQENPERFRGKRILYIHTGGVFGMYDGRLEEKLRKDAKSQRNIFMWPNVTDECPYDGIV